MNADAGHSAQTRSWRNIQYSLYNTMGSGGEGAQARAHVLLVRVLFTPRAGLFRPLRQSAPAKLSLASRGKGAMLAPCRYSLSRTYPTIVKSTRDARSPASASPHRRRRLPARLHSGGRRGWFSIVLDKRPVARLRSLPGVLIGFAGPRPSRLTETHGSDGTKLSV